MKKDKLILLVGEWSSTNLGDQVLCKCVEELISKNFPNLNTYRLDISYGLSYNLTKKIKWLPYRLYFRLSGNTLHRDCVYSKIKAGWISKDLRSLSRNIGAIIFCGGQMFIDYFAKQIREICKFAKIEDIPLFFNACGAGKCSKSAISEFRECLSPISDGMLTVRDNFDFFSNVLYSRPVLVPDPAVFSSNLLGNSCLRSNGKIGIGIQHPDSFKQYIIDKQRLSDTLLTLIGILSDKGYNVELFTNGSKFDYIFLEEIMNNINRDNVSAAPLPDNGSQLVKQIASYSKIVSFRLHSHIIAYSCKIPSFGFIWDDKVKDFFAMTGNMGNCCELNNINIADIVHFAEAGESHFDKLDLLQQESENSLISNVCNIV